VGRASVLPVPWFRSATPALARPRLAAVGGIVRNQGASHHGISRLGVHTFALPLIPTPYRVSLRFWLTGQRLYHPGVCVFSQSFRAVSTRVCQPLPLARKVSTTLRDRRWPRLTLGLTAAHSASVNELASGSDWAAAVMAVSSSGVGRIVPGLSIGLALYLSAVGLAQADEAAGCGAIHKNRASKIGKRFRCGVLLFGWCRLIRQIVSYVESSRWLIKRNMQN
jgi:hypothetical protein